MSKLADWGQVYVDGKLVRAEEAAASAFDRGIMYGDGIYETVRVYKGKPFMLEAHIKRMEHGCSVIEMAPPSAADVRRGVSQVLEANNLKEAYVRITATRGPTGKLWFDPESDAPTLLIFARPMVLESFVEGLNLIISKFRTDEESPLCGIKMSGILPKIMARTQALRAGAHDALLLNTKEVVSEATAANAFWVKDGMLFTPCMTCGLLDGITRSVIMELAVPNDIPAVVGQFTLEDVLSADEMFLTSSTWEVAPVVSLEGKSFGKVPGPVTARIHKLYRSRVNELCGK